MHYVASIPEGGVSEAKSFKVDSDLDLLVHFADSGLTESALVLGRHLRANGEVGWVGTLSKNYQFYFLILQFQFTMSTLDKNSILV